MRITHTTISLVSALALAMCVLASCNNDSRLHNVAEVSSDPYSGIDVSRHQRDIDWDKVGCDSCVRFVYIKATEGSTLVDTLYAANIEGARRVGIKVGSYHYFSTQSSVQKQYANFKARLDEHRQDLIPMIDVEDSGNWGRSQLLDSVAEFASLLERDYGRKPMIYSTAEFYNDILAPQFNSYPLYIGRYSSSQPQLKWGAHYTIWQFTEHGIITGINRHVDLCSFAAGKTINDISL